MGELAKRNDVIQLEPETAGAAWGPLLCVVSEVKAWGVQCYALIPTTRDQPPGSMWMRIDHGKYAVIGPAMWTVEP